MTAAQDLGHDLRVALLGTGIMGAAMARRLIAAGLPTTVWDRSASATEPLGQAGAKVAASAAEAAAGAGVVITMLPTADVVTAVVFDGGVAGAFAPGAVWAQMGTIGAAATTDIAGRLGAARPDVPFVDAPESPLAWPLKDVALALRAAAPDTLPLLAALARHWRAAVDAGHGRQDISAARLALGE